MSSQEQRKPQTHKGEARRGHVKTDRLAGCAQSPQKPERQEAPYPGASCPLGFRIPASGLCENELVSLNHPVSHDTRQFWATDAAVQRPQIPAGSCLLLPGSRQVTTSMSCHFLVSSPSAESWSSLRTFSSPQTSALGPEGEQDTTAARPGRLGADARPVVVDPHHRGLRATSTSGCSPRPVSGRT